MLKELSNVTLRIPQGGLCSLELVINGPTPTTHFPLQRRGAWCCDWHASNLGSIRVGLRARCHGGLPITKPQSFIQSSPRQVSVLMRGGGGHPPPSHVEVWLFHESLECSSVFSALGDYLYCVGFMFNLKFLFLLDFFSVAAGQQFNAAPASLAKVPALIYQYVPSLCKGGGVATRGEEMS